MKKFILLLSLFITLSVNLFSAPDKDFEQACRLYQAGKYDFALDKFLNIRKAGFESEELYFNIANSYYKLSNYPKAVLYYEKTLKLNPAYEDAQVNLRISNLKIVDKINEIEPFFLVKWLKAYTTYFSPTIWAIFFIIGLSVASAFFILQIFLHRPRYKKLFFALGIISFSLAFMNLATAIYSNYKLNTSNAAIVITQAVNVKSGLDPTADVSFVLHEGTKVSILEDKDNWYKIKLGDGREGWMPKKDAENI